MTKTIVSTCGTSLAGKKHKKRMWRENGNSSDIYYKEIDRDATTTEYFERAGKVDMHNRYRQGYLQLD